MESEQDTSLPNEASCYGRSSIGEQSQPSSPKSETSLVSCHLPIRNAIVLLACLGVQNQCVGLRVMVCAHCQKNLEQDRNTDTSTQLNQNLFAILLEQQMTALSSLFCLRNPWIGPAPFLKPAGQAILPNPEEALHMAFFREPKQNVVGFFSFPFDSF
jgi:hypothetical protein